MFPLYLLGALIYFGTSYYAYSMISPIYMGASGYDSDPAYVYLLNGLMLLHGNAPGHVDHPGTPLQVFCAITILLRWGLRRIFSAPNIDDISTDVLADPEGYIRTASIALLAINALALAYLGLRTAQATGKTWAGASILLMPFLFPILIPRSIYLSPEALLIPTSICLLATLLPGLFTSNEFKTAQDNHTPVLSGVLFGFGLAVKFTFLPLIILLLLQKGVRRSITSISFALISFIAFISPAWPKFHYIINWINAIVQHTGHYGQGASGIIDWANIPKHAANLLAEFPLTVSIAILLLIAPTTLRQPSSNGLRAIPLSLSCIIILQLSIVLKHYGTHYMIPALPISLLGAIWLLWAVSSENNGSTIRRIIPALLVCIGLFVGYRSTSNTLTAISESRTLINKEYKEISHVLEAYPDSLIVCSYRCGLPQSAISFGASYTDGKLDQKTKSFLANYTEVSHAIYQPDPDYSVDKINRMIQNGKNVLLLSTNNAQWLKYFSGEPILVLSSRTLYKVDRLSHPD